MAACGDDGAPSGSGEGTTAADTDATSNASPDPTTPTVLTTNSMDPTGTTTGEPESTSTGEDTTTGGPLVPEGEPTAFRMTSMFIREPHVFAEAALLKIPCTDITDTGIEAPIAIPSINDAFNTSLNSDDDTDGLLDLGVVIVFYDHDQSDVGAGETQFGSAACTAPIETTSCSFEGVANPTTTEYASAAKGICLEPNPDHLSTAGYDPLPNSAAGPCFSAGPATLTIDTGVVQMVLDDAQVGATYAGDPADGLIAGTITGFMPTAAAEGAMLPNEFALAGLTNVAQVLPGYPGNCAEHDDTDGDGWWFYVDFTAEAVEWTVPE